MGADIHGLLQARYAGSKHWFNECEIEDGRNYVLFSVLANVRNYNDLIPIAAPRGLPEDSGFSAETEQIGSVWMGDHSYTWFTLDELSEWDGWDQKIGDESVREYVQTFLLWLEYAKSKTRGMEARIVIGFDS